VESLDGLDSRLKKSETLPEQTSRYIRLVHLRALTDALLCKELSQRSSWLSKRFLTSLATLKSKALNRVMILSTLTVIMLANMEALGPKWTSMEEAEGPAAMLVVEDEVEVDKEAEEECRRLEVLLVA